ncbi:MULTISPECIES: DNA/RNA non-specific endonuclease [Lactiplantibacillus]|uniref:DNA/RNA non-specific endonuclease n=2 Tax=Lactiplantibacillus pentosus TaxID=1589 RepID=A0AAW8VZ19_LACPE|nr:MULTISPECIES: DNA/RNA non-specific endonuclease [Lactiplantibacillus]CCC16488.1 prophage Lp1 protein 65 [Lactiplantibacillus pentosus IG1]MBU7475199.1 DNA/RNA non-specific endonuclease [Lactiplantibacillus pentosus]MBU7530470.1 DNA/RNA non-specific endonuclease [Lactiplantibacillus pentosus]MCM8609552.1 DNA/RNA non-specific endonuclease [Lactiplantibacillus sp. B652]MCT3283596.1 hydroxyacid dehydrogenase [Lactiplantibacillus pentosus]
MGIIGTLILLAAIYWGWRSYRHYPGRQWWRHGWPALLLLLVSIGLFSLPGKQAQPTVKTKTVTKTHLVTATNDQKLTALQEANSASASSLKQAAKQLSKDKTQVDNQKKKNQQAGATSKTAATTTTGSNPSNAALANKAYAGQQTITVNQNQPAFSRDDLSTSRGAWQKYGDLDQLNRVTAANALLNQSLMPKAEREALNVQPTGWHNKRISSGWLYNRSHLIGYQLTGQNNNIKNLMTGTRTLNDPEMTTYEDQVADYLKASPNNYVRYQVTPIFRGNELLARGVQMRGQSVGSNAVSFNVYIFNVQPGMTLNYNDGTSSVSR